MRHFLKVIFKHFDKLYCKIPRFQYFILHFSGGTNGTSNGLVPMLRVYNNTARYVDQVLLILFLKEGSINTLDIFIFHLYLSKYLL